MIRSLVAGVVLIAAAIVLDAAQEARNVREEIRTYLDRLDEIGCNEEDSW